MKAITLLPLIGLLLLLVGSKGPSEKYYQDLIAEKWGVPKENVEKRLPDATRVDILTDEVAYEVDFARKWAEGIGQALHYSVMTERGAGLILIVKNEKENKHVLKVQNIMEAFSLRIVLYVYNTETKTLKRVGK